MRLQRRWNCNGIRRAVMSYGGDHTSPAKKHLRGGMMERAGWNGAASRSGSVRLQIRTSWPFSAPAIANSIVPSDQISEKLLACHNQPHEIIVENGASRRRARSSFASVLCSVFGTSHQPYPSSPECGRISICRRDSSQSCCLCDILLKPSPDCLCAHRWLFQFFNQQAAAAAI